MKLRLDEYYYIVSWDWDGIERYMPEDMAKKFNEFCKSHNLEEIDNYIEIIDSQYNINSIDFDKAYIKYTAIIKINDKYYSFDWYYTEYLSFDEQVNADKDLIEVTPKEVTTVIYV